MMKPQKKHYCNSYQNGQIFIMECLPKLYNNTFIKDIKRYQEEGEKMVLSYVLEGLKSGG